MARDASAIEMELQVMLKEYDNMRREITRRIRIQKDVERSQIILIGIFAAAVGWIWDKEIYSLFLVASAVFFIIGIAFFEQDINIALIAGYLHRGLRPHVLSLFVTPERGKVNYLMGWEEFRSKEFLKTAISLSLTINRTLLTYIPGFATLGGYLLVKYYLKKIPQTWNEIEMLLLFLNILLLIFLFAIGFKVPQFYREIAAIERRR